MKRHLIEIPFTAFIVAMIVLPLPPSTIIGIALATNPKTGKYMNKHAYRGTMFIVRYVVLGAKYPVKAIANGREASAKQRIESGTVRL